MIHVATPATMNSSSSRTLPETPLWLRLVTLSKSSRKPITPKPTVTARQAQTSGVAGFIQISIEITSEVRIISPPIVGVPTLAWCVCGPSSRIGWPLPWRTRSMLMNFGPITRPMNSAVSSVAPARNVW